MTCQNHNHLFELAVNGWCSACLRTIGGLVIHGQNVWKRIELIKKLDV